MFFDDVELFSSDRRHTVAFVNKVDEKSIVMNVLTKNNWSCCHWLTDFFFDIDDRFEFFDRF